MQLVTILGMLVAAGGVFFTMQNHETVAVSLFFWHFEASLGIVILLSLTMGALIVALVSTPSTLRRQWTVNKQQKRIEELELRVEALQRETAARSGEVMAAGASAESLYKEMPRLIAAGDNRDSN